VHINSSHFLLELSAISTVCASVILVPLYFTPNEFHWEQLVLPSSQMVNYIFLSKQVCTISTALCYCLMWHGSCCNSWGNKSDVLNYKIKIKWIVNNCTVWARIDTINWWAITCKTHRCHKWEQIHVGKIMRLNLSLSLYPSSYTLKCCKKRENLKYICLCQNKPVIIQQHAYCSNMHKFSNK